MNNVYIDFSPYNYISFDVFDTLIIRDAPHPTDVFTLVAGKAFKYARILAEVVARKLKNNCEVTLDEIYRFLPLKYKQFEINKELEICRVNPDIFELFNELKRSGKKIYAVSDMYLPREVIEKILYNAGYDVDGVFVSSEYDECKSTGLLFEAVLNELNISPEQIIHIGDNELADIQGARSAGIKALKIEKHTSKTIYTSKSSHSLELRGFINHGLNGIDNRAEQIGYEVFGPLLVSFCQWLHSQKELYGFEKLLFMSRDMHIVYDTYMKMYGDNDIIYFYVSRKALNAAISNDSGFRAYMKKCNISGNVAVVDTGWRCVAQPIIEHYAKKDCPNIEIGGLYFGVKWGFKFIKRSPKSTACFFSNSFERIECQTYSSFIESFLGYAENKPIDYTHDGLPIFEDDNKSLNNTIKMQDGAFEFLNDWLSIKKNKKIDCKTAIRAYKNIFNRPLYSDMKLIGNTEYDDVETTKIINYHKSSNASTWLNNLRYSAWKGAYFKTSFKGFYKVFYYVYLILDSLYLSYKDYKDFRKKTTEELLKYY